MGGSVGSVVLWCRVPGIMSRGGIMGVYDGLMSRVGIIDVNGRGIGTSSRHPWWRMSLRTYIAPFWCAGLVSCREHVCVLIM